MKKPLKGMANEPIDVINRMLPPKHRERWLALMGEMQPRTLTPEELREAWGENLGAW